MWAWSNRRLCFKPNRSWSKKKLRIWERSRKGGWKCSGDCTQRVSISRHAQLFCDPMDCSPPSFSVHGISQGRILEWVFIFFSRESPSARYQTHISCIGKQILYHWVTREAPLPQSCYVYFHSQRTLAKNLKEGIFNLFPWLFIDDDEND